MGSSNKKNTSKFVTKLNISVISVNKIKQQQAKPLKTCSPILSNAVVF